MPLPNADNPTSHFRWFAGRLFDILRRHGNTICFWLGVGYCVHQASLAAQTFAGKQSNAAFSLLANVTVAWGLNISVSGLSIALYVRERSLHRKTRERLTKRITMLELKVDPKRSSSHLTSKGLTQKEDE